MAFVAETSTTNNIITKLHLSLLGHMPCSIFYIISISLSPVSSCLKSFLSASFKAGHTVGDMSRNMLRNMHVTGHVAGHVPSVWQNVPMFNVFRNM